MVNKSREDALLLCPNGAPNALLEIFQAYEAGLHRPRGDLSKPLTGVFSTRSPDRPSPLGLHRVTAMKTGHLYIGPMEAIDGNSDHRYKARRRITGLLGWAHAVAGEDRLL